MVKKQIGDDLIKVVDKTDRDNLVTILAWGDEVDLIDESDPQFNEIKTFWYKDVDDTNFERIEVLGLIDKKVVLKDPNELKILKTSFVDVQQGDGICIETPKDRKILIDGGDNVLFARYLAQRFIGSSKANPLIVDAMIVTHGDADHFAGLTQIQKSETHSQPRKRLFLRPKRIFHNGIVKGPSSSNGRSIPDQEILGKTEMKDNKLYLTEIIDDLLQMPAKRLNKPFKEWVQAIKAWLNNGNSGEPLHIRRLQFGDDSQFSFLHDEDIEIKVLGPFTEQISGRPALPMLTQPPKQIAIEMEDDLKGTSKSYSASHTINGHSIVLQMKYGNVRFLLTGDLNQESSLELQARMHNGGLNLESEIFKVPHHGSADFSHTFIDKVKPVVSIISSGDENARKEYIHPRATIVGSLGRYSRVPRPLIFVTEMVAFFQYLGSSELKKSESSLYKAGYKYYGFKRSSFGIVHVRTDGKRVFVFTHSGKHDMKEAYAFKVDGVGEIETVKVTMK
jgi:beta-lactamase superfamily II metal-dependent hydrolase